MLASPAMSEVVESDGKKPETPMINGAIHVRKEKTTVIAGLDVKKILTEYKQLEFTHDLFVIPLHVSSDGRLDDVAGEASTAGAATIDMFVVLTEDKVKEVFPSLVSFANWKKTFSDAHDKIEPILAELEIKKIALFIPSGPYHLTNTLAQLCSLDMLIKQIGPVVKTK
jgi:hypothetical protein